MKPIHVIAWVFLLLSGLIPIVSTLFDLRTDANIGTLELAQGALLILPTCVFGFEIYRQYKAGTSR